MIALLNEPLRSEDNVAVIVDRCGEAIELSHVKRRNPYTLQFSVPDKCLQVSMLVGVRINKNGVPLGVRQVKCESRLRELDQILRAHDNPLEFICQVHMIIFRIIFIKAKILEVFHIFIFPLVCPVADVWLSSR